MKQALIELVQERALRLKDLGPKPTMTLFNSGRRLPGPRALSRMATVLDLPAVSVMAACRESQRRALVARGRSLALVGKSHRRVSCTKPSRAGVRKVGHK